MSIKTLRAISDSVIDQLEAHFKNCPSEDKDMAWWVDHQEMIENLRTEGRMVEVYYCDVCDAEIEDFSFRHKCYDCHKHICNKCYLTYDNDSVCEACSLARQAKYKKEREEEKYREYLSLKEKFEKKVA